MAGDTQESSSTTTTRSQPYANDLLGWGKSIVNSGAAWKPDTTSHVVPFSTQTTDAMKGLTAAAKSGQGYADENFFRVAGQLRDGGLNNLQDQQIGRLQSIAGQPIAEGDGALNNIQRQGVSGYQSLANQAPQQGTAALNDVQRQSLGGFQGMANTAASQGSAALNDVQRNAMNLLNPIAGGAQLTGNPYLEDMIARGSQDIGNAGNLMASAAGRYGSDSHAQALGKQIADFAGNSRFNDYTNQQARRDSAIAQLTGIGNQADSQYQFGANRQLAGLQGVAGMGNQANNQYGEGVNRQLAGLAGVSGMGNQANAQTDAARARQADAIGSLYNAGAQQRQNVLNGTQQIADAYAARLQPYNTLLGVGAKNEDLYARTLADRVRVNAAKQSAVTAPLDYLAQLANLFQGGTTVQTGTQPGKSPLSKGISGALSGYATTGNPFGAANPRRFGRDHLMSGNSSGDPMAAINNNVPAQTPPWMKNVSPQTVPQAMPGQLEALAAQLAQGFAGPDRQRIANAQAAYFKDLNNTYDPVQSMKFGTTPAPAPKPVAKPIAPPSRWTRGRR